MFISGYFLNSTKKSQEFEKKSLYNYLGLLKFTRFIQMFHTNTLGSYNN